jgi:hypothetical protein
MPASSTERLTTTSTATWPHRPLKGEPLADRIASHDIEDGVSVRFKDMLDGTFAEMQIAAALPGLVNSMANTPASSNVATIPAVAGKFSYLTGFEVTGTGATAGSTIAITVAGLAGGSIIYYLTIPAGATAALTPPLVVPFSAPLPSSAVNTAITVTAPSFGAGNLNASVIAHGYQQ